MFLETSEPVHVFAFAFMVKSPMFICGAAAHRDSDAAGSELDEREAEKVPFLSRQIGIYQRWGEIEETGDPCS